MQVTSGITQDIALNLIFSVYKLTVLVSFWQQRPYGWLPRMFFQNIPHTLLNLILNKLVSKILHPIYHPHRFRTRSNTVAIQMTSGILGKKSKAFDNLVYVKKLLISVSQNVVKEIQTRMRTSFFSFCSPVNECHQKSLSSLFFRSKQGLYKLSEGNLDGRECKLISRSQAMPRCSQALNNTAPFSTCKVSIGETPISVPAQECLSVCRESRPTPPQIFSMMYLKWDSPGT